MDKPDYLIENYTTEEAIRERLLSHVSDDVDKSEGSYIWDALAPAAIELVFVHMALQKVLELGFAETTDLSHLILRAKEHGVYRKEATKATGTIHVKGTAGTVLPKDFKVATEADADIGVESVYFVTTKEAFIPNSGEIDIPIESVAPGKIGNVASGSIVILAQSRSGVESVTNNERTTGGTDAEEFDSLLKRYLEKVRNPGTSGNVSDYKQWAMSINGVGDAKVIPLWNGNGTVKIIIIDENKDPASEEIVSSVQEFLTHNNGTGDRQAPIGASVTVVSATAVKINIAATVISESKDSGALQEIKNNLTKLLTAYFKSIAFQTNTVRYARIGTILLGIPGVIDYNNLIINSITGNISLKDDEIPVIGAVTISAE